MVAPSDRSLERDMTRRGACVLIKARFGSGILVHTPCPCDARQSPIGCVFARVRSVTSVNKGPSADAQDAVADTQRPRSAHPVRGHEQMGGGQFPAVWVCARGVGGARRVRGLVGRGVGVRLFGRAARWGELGRASRCSRSCVARVRRA